MSLEGLNCHAGKQELHRAASAAGKSETLEGYARDYPLGPHDQPQSMCPAFGSLRVGLRMRRTATLLSGSAMARTTSAMLVNSLSSTAAWFHSW